nr:hypothetical protein CFP56_71201 [Quercus suber]
MKKNHQIPISRPSYGRLGSLSPPSSLSQILSADLKAPLTAISSLPRHQSKLESQPHERRQIFIGHGLPFSQPKTHPNLSDGHHCSGPASSVSTPVKNTDHADLRMMPRNADSTRSECRLQLGFLGLTIERREELGLREPTEEKS